MNASHKVRRDGRINLKLCSRPKVMIFFLLKFFICSENLTLCVMLNQDVSETLLFHRILSSKRIGGTIS